MDLPGIQIKGGPGPRAARGRSCIASALFCAALGAASACHGVAGVTGADILTARLGARPEAMGEAYTALGDDLASAPYNPAGLGGLTGPSVNFSHYNAIAQVSYENFAYAQPLSFGTFGLNFDLRNQPDIDNLLATDNPVSVYDLVLDLSYAQKPSYFLDGLPELLRQTTVGVSLKWVRSHLDTYDADSGAVDVGTRTDLGDGITLGLAALNFGPPIRFIEVSDPLPSSLNVGVSKKIELFAHNVLNVDVDLEYPIYSDSRLHFGAEDWLGKSLALRAGYILGNTNSTDGFSAGLSLHLDQETLIFSIDYAFKPAYYSGFNSFDVQNLFSLSLGF
jgi:hypothetical protein